MRPHIGKCVVRATGGQAGRGAGPQLLWILAVIVTGSTALGQTITRVSVSTTGQEGNGNSTGPAISHDGRYVAFSSEATNLVSGDTNLMRDIFVHDRETGVTIRVSAGPGGAQANEESDRPTISGDGRLVAFYSDANNLIPDDTNEDQDIFVHDRDPDENGVFDEGNGLTLLASVATDGDRADDDSNRPSISSSGRYIAFRTKATTLVPGDDDEADDILVHDLLTSTTVDLR